MFQVEGLCHCYRVRELAARFGVSSKHKIPTGRGQVSEGSISILIFSEIKLFSFVRMLGCQMMIVGDVSTIVDATN
jgi:hypothetical protein